MPIASSMYKSLKKKYGAEKGRKVYFAMENSGKPSFRKAVRTARKRGHVIGLRRKKK